MCFTTHAFPPRVSDVVPLSSFSSLHRGGGALPGIGPDAVAGGVVTVPGDVNLVRRFRESGGRRKLPRRRAGFHLG